MNPDATDDLEPFRNYLKVLAELHLDRSASGLAADQTSPSGRAERNEELMRLVAALPDAMRVGQAERLWRWCRRNPAVASLGTSVAACLLVIAALSTLYAFQANARARNEQRLRLRAEQAKTGMERTFAQSLVRPRDRGGPVRPRVRRRERDGTNPVTTAPMADSILDETLAT